MLFAIAAVVAAIPSAPLERVSGVAERCDVGIIQTDFARGKFDRQTPLEGGFERRPDTEKPVLLSTVDRKVGGCSVPVIRARAGSVGGLIEVAPPVEVAPKIVPPVER